MTNDNILVDTDCLALAALYLRTDPYAEGARARAAGLTMDDQPYLLWPCVAERWAAGFEGEVE